jgi:hypothetical protein
VARLCGRNGIIKAVLLNYIYNYHKPNSSKGIGHPACISLAEFVDQYTSGDIPLWRRSFIHKILKDLAKDRHLSITKNRYHRPVYAVSQEIATFLSNEEAVWVSFGLEDACKCGIYIAIVTRFLLHVIDSSPKKAAYNLDVQEMASVNCISPAQIYKVINFLIKCDIVKKDKSMLKHPTRALCLVRCKREKQPNVAKSL